MKRKMLVIIIALIIILLPIGALIAHYRFRQKIGDLEIAHYISGQSSDLGYLDVHLNAILPEEKYHGNLTMNLIRVWVIIRHEKIPDYIEITLYDTMDSLRIGNSYAKKIFQK